MRKSLLRILRAPSSSEPLMLHPFEKGKSGIGEEEDIAEGILFTSISKKAYPIIAGVPIMLDSQFPQGFLQKYGKAISEIEALTGLNLTSREASEWSFSSEWKAHFDYNATTTWGWTVEERVQQFLLETDIDASWCKGKLILDAGCGNGQLSERLTDLGATVIALDLSDSVFEAERRRKCPNVHFVKGDLQAPPFDSGAFDIIISNGVFICTPDTYRTFAGVAKLVKAGGRFYLWVYRRPERFSRRYILYPLLDLIRGVVSRMPRKSQGLCVRAYALALIPLHKLLGKHKDRSWGDRVVGAYDGLTPRWRHYHTPTEVSYWFFLNGYSPATLTHWDNSYGFGMVATKIPQKTTPGMNFGKKEGRRRYWS